MRFDIRVTLGSRRGLNEIFALLGCYVAWVCVYLLTFRDSLPVLSPRVSRWVFFIFLMLFYYACSIIISNTTCLVGLHIYFFSKLTYLLYTQVSDSSTCYFILYNFSRVMLNTYLLKILAYLLIRLSLLSNIILPSTYASIIFSSHPVFLTNFVP